MGRSKMSSLKITLLPLAICLLLSLNSQVSRKPSPKHFLIETKENAKKSSDYVKNINNSGNIHSVIDGSTNVDYVKNINNDGHITKVDDRSLNIGDYNNEDYIGIGTLNNSGKVEENNNNYHHYYGKK